MKLTTRDLILYVIVGLCLAAGAVLWPFVIPEPFWPHLTHAWFSFIFSTFALVIVLAKMYWPMRNSVKVWLLLTLLLGVHIIGYTILLRSIPQWPAVSYIVTVPVEVMAINLVTKICLNVLPRNVKL